MFKVGDKVDVMRDDWFYKTGRVVAFAGIGWNVETDDGELLFCLDTELEKHAN